MSILTFPTGIRISDAIFGLQFNTQVFQSPLTMQTQTIANPGARWMATFTLTPHNRAEFAELQAFLMQLQGAANKFYAFDPDAVTPRGVATGIPLVNGANQTGTNLITDGWTPNVTGILKKGDYIQVDDQLRMLTADATSDSGGNATLTFSPVFRVSPGDNHSIITTRASVPMKMIDDQQAIWTTDYRGLYTLTFQAAESF